MAKMWKHKLLPLLIWMLLGIKGKATDMTAIQSSNEMETTSNPTISVIDLQEPIIMVPLQQDPLARALDVPLSSHSGVKAVGWAGPGEVRNTLNAQPPPDLPKWLPDFQPVKEKHWNVIVDALDTTRRQQSDMILRNPTEATYLEITEPYDILLPIDPSDLGPLFNKNIIESRNDFLHVIPNGQTNVALHHSSGEDLVAPQSFNPFNIFLPDHIPRNNYQTINTKNRRNHQQNVYERSKYFDESDNIKEIKYITWPNTGQDNTATQTHYLPMGNTFGTRKDISLTQPLLASNTNSASENISWQEKIQQVISGSQKNKKMKQWPDLTNSESSSMTSTFRDSIQEPLTEFPFTTANKIESKIANNPPKTKQWPDLTNEETIALPASTLPTKQWPDLINEETVALPTFSLTINPLKTNLTNSLDTQTLVSSGPLGKSNLNKLSPPPVTTKQSKQTPSIKTSTTETPQNQKKGIQIKKNIGDNSNSSEHNSNSSEHTQSRVTTTFTNQQTAVKANDEVYSQPWLHAAVQHDLRKWGHPYDEDALPNPYLSPLQNPLQSQEILMVNSFTDPQKNKSPNTQIEKTSGVKTQEHHLAIVEVPQGSDTGPLKIENVHVIAPKPDRMPPMPPFHPAEKKPIDTPPYFLRGVESRSQGSKDSDPMLIVPYPSESSDYDTSDINPIIVPLSAATERQGSSTFHNIMRPLRNIFQTARQTQNIPPNNPVRQIVPRDIPPEMQPPPIIQQHFHDFGPPKGEDVVSTTGETPQEDKEIADIHETFTEPPPAESESNDQSFSSQSLKEQPDSENTTVFSPETQPLTIQNEIASINNPAQPQFQPPPRKPSHIVNTQTFHHLPPPPPPPPQGNKARPPVLGIFHEEPSTIQSSPTPKPKPSFIPWPNPTTLAPNTSSSTPPRPFNLFNRAPTFPPLRLPSLANMQFFNPFNMFRSRENPNSNKPFQWFPSFLSKNGKDSNSHRQRESQGTWPSLRSSYQSHGSHSQPYSANKNNRFLRNAKPSIGANTVKYHPHLTPTLGIKKPKFPPPQIPHTLPRTTATPAYYTLSKPLVQTSSDIHKLHHTDSEATAVIESQSNLQTSTEKYLDDTIFIVSSNNKEHKSQNNAVVNPQTNPARIQHTDYTETKENLGPTLLKFTLDDVIKRPSSLHKNNQQATTKFPFTKTEGLRNTEPKIDMDLAPSEGVVTVTHLPKEATSVRPSSSSKPKIRQNFNHWYTHTPTTMKETVKPSSTPGTLQPKNNATPNASLLSTGTHRPIFFSHPPRLKPKFQLPKTNHSQFTNQELKSTTIAPTTSKLSLSELPSNFKPFITPSPKEPETKPPFTNMNWRFSQPADTESTKIPDSQGRSKTQNLMSAASTRVTIIEATPMPRAGEIFPTVKHFGTYTPPTLKTTTKALQPPVTESIVKTSPTSARLGILHGQSHEVQSSNSPNTQKKEAILMPGMSNHRTMLNLPKIQSDPTITSNSQTTSTETQNLNKLQIRYNAPPRKVFHAHKTTANTEVSGFSTSLTPPTVSVTNNNPQVNTPSSPKVVPDVASQASTMMSVMRRLKSNKVTSNQNEEETSESLTTSKPTQTINTTQSTSTSTSRPLLVGRPSRYNSLQRLRDFLGRKKKVTNGTSTAISTTPATPKQTSYLTSSTATMTTPTTAPTTHTTQNTPRSFTSHRTYNSRKTTHTPRQIRTTTPITRVPKKLQSPSITSTLPSSITSNSKSLQTSNFKQTDYEPNGSDSSFSYEWQPPVHGVNLQDHPEMFDIFNWESTRVDKTHMPANISPQQYVAADNAGNVGVLSSESINSSPKIFSPMQHTPTLLRERRSLPPANSNPTGLSPKQTPSSNSMAKVREEISSMGHNSRAWNL